MLGYADPRGGGTFHDARAISNIPQRNGISAIDTLYLKSVLFKFIEAMAQSKTNERDLILPAVSMLSGVLE